MRVKVDRAAQNKKR